MMRTELSTRHQFAPGRKSSLGGQGWLCVSQEQVKSSLNVSAVHPLQFGGSFFGAAEHDINLF
jgi:hypothetical protein